MNALFDPRVGIFDTGRRDYPEYPPFHPPENYPEYPFTSGPIDETNYIYDAIRRLFHLLEMDREHFGSPSWNPLGKIIRPSDNVVLKPNLVVSEHPDGLLGIQASVVHGSIIRPFIDYAWIANQGRGRITIADSPIKEVDFARIIDLTGIGSTVEYLNKKHGLGIVVVGFSRSAGHARFRSSHDRQPAIARRPRRLPNNRSRQEKYVNRDCRPRESVPKYCCLLRKRNR